MNELFNIIGIPLEYILRFFNNFFKNYPLSILVFTFVVNACLIPLNIKQQKTTAKQAKLKPKLDALKEKFGDDRMKYSTAMNELYQREGVNALGGCLPLLFRMPILIGVYQAVKNLVEALGAKNPEFMLFGMDLSQTPKFSTDIIGKFQIIWIIPLLSLATSLLSMVITNSQNKKNNPQMAQAGGAMKGMMLMMPLFSLYIAFQVPGGVGFYWACSNIVNTIIQVSVNHFYSTDKIIAKDIAIDGSKRRKAERIKIEAANGRRIED